MQCAWEKIYTKIEKNQPVEQAGFRQVYSTTDHIHTLEQVIEKYEKSIRVIMSTTRKRLILFHVPKGISTVKHQDTYKVKFSRIYIEKVQTGSN